MHKLQPPSFTDAARYELYKSQLQAWEKLTDVPDEKQGLYIALSLPDKSSSHIKEKVFEELGNDELSKKGGLSELIKFLDKHLLKESLEDSWAK